MSVLVDLCQIAVGAFLLAAAVLKLAAPSDVVAAAVRLGVPQRALLGWRGRALRPLLVSVDLLLAAALLVPASARVSAVVTAGMLLGFGVLMARAVVRGEQGDCGCFGAASGRLGWPSVLRNGLASAAALIVAILGAASTASFLRFVVVVAATVTSGLVVAVVLLARAFRLRPTAGREPEAVSAPVLGQIDSSWLWRLSDGTTRAAGILLQGRPSVLLFTDPGCAPCQAVLATLRASRPHRADRQLVVVSRGSPEANEKLGKELPGIPVVVQDDFEIARSLGVPGTPVALQVTGSGIVVGVQTTGAAAVTALVNDLFRPIAADR